MELLKHFSHRHMLSLVHFDHSKEKFDHHVDTEEEDNEEVEAAKRKEDDFVEEEDHHGGQCNMCKEEIYSFHLCYYKCNEYDCDYSLHKFCAQLPETLQDHPLHPGHGLERDFHQKWNCSFCKLKPEGGIYFYSCSICLIFIDIICATISEQKMDHPSHPHQLQRARHQMVSRCNACGDEHKGIFYHCTTCSCFWINLDCALLPSKFSIQRATNETFTHSHQLNLAFSFPYVDYTSKKFPRCRICNECFYDLNIWLYKCDRCRYYVHLSCATLISKKDPFMSIFLPPGLGKTYKNFRDEDHPNLLRCPFPDESHTLVKHQYFLNHKDDLEEVNDVIGDSHQHPLILFNEQTLLNGSNSFSLHDPMNRSQLLCDGCVKPITTLPFYKCSQDVGRCRIFVLHEWCAKLPSDVIDHPSHREHALILMRNIPSKFFGVFKCKICRLPSNGFAYGCTSCEYYVDINCAFVPEEITHEAHPNHLLRITRASVILSNRHCKACFYNFLGYMIVFYCPSCDFYLHVECAFLLPKMMRHKFDKHPLTLRYQPAENHVSNYFCEICEEELDPDWDWFYHCICAACAQSMHCPCVPLILECEQAVCSTYKRCVFKFLNIKFGGTLKIEGHQHELSFVQGLKRHGLCKWCDDPLQYKMIFKCSDCDFALHYKCASD